MLDNTMMKNFTLKWLLANTLPSLILLLGFALLQRPPDVLLLIVDVLLIGLGLGIGQALVFAHMQKPFTRRWRRRTAAGFSVGIVFGGLVGMVATFFYILLLGLIFNVLLGLEDYTGDPAGLTLLVQIIFVLPIPTLVGAFGGLTMSAIQSTVLAKHKITFNTGRWLLRSALAGGIAGALIGSLFVVLIRLDITKAGLYFAALTPLFVGIPLALLTQQQAQEVLESALPSLES